MMQRFQFHLRRALLATVTIDAESEHLARQFLKKMTDKDLEWEVELPKQIIGVDVIDNSEE